MSFANRLLTWYQKNGRKLPWRETKNPYIIWLSEIISQQTRVEQGMPYFYKFVEHYPYVEDFAKASEEAILREWQGLGYYSRARNMHRAAKKVMQDFDGIFPTDFKSLLQLPGIGEYTAAAISSFAANEKQAVVDGNVFRVLSRCFGIEVPINSTEGKKLFSQLAQDLISQEYPGLYNHAIMDYGATVCKPKSPLCHECIFREECAAYQEGLVDSLPVKIKSKPSRNRYFHYFVFEKDDQYLVSKRGEGDVWANLYEFPLIETQEEVFVDNLIELPEFKMHFEGAKIEPIGSITKHILSHQNIYARFYRVKEIFDVSEKKPNWHYCFSEKLDKLAKHKLIYSFLTSLLSSNH